MRPLPSAAAVVVDSGSRIRQQRRHRRRPPPPAAPTACGSASALGTCLLALIVNTAGESSALATAFLADGGGSGSRSPACFLHAAAAGGARDRDGGGSGRRRSACGAGLLGATARRRGCNDSRGESAGHRSRLATAAAAWGRESEGEVLPVRAGRGVAAAAHGRGSRWEQGGKGRAAGGGGSLYMLKTGGGGGGIKAAGKMEAAATASVGDAREALGATAAAPADLQDLAKLKLAELKLLYRESGGKPGSLRKAELVQRLSESRQIGTVTGSPGTLVVEEAAPAAVLAAAPEHPSPTVLESSPNGGAAAAPVAAVAGRGGGAETSAASSLFSVLSGGGAVADPAPPVLESQPKAGTENAAAGATPLPGKGGADSSAAGSLFSVLSGSGAGAEADNPAGRAPHESGPVVPATATEWSHESPPATLDVLSSGPSAVVAAARARGAAAAAESSRLAAGGRMRARAEAQRHTEAMRTRATAAAASTSSSINNNGGGRGRGNGGGGGGGGGGAYSVIVDSPVARRSGQRQRRLPAVPNPWSRGGVGGDAEGMPLEGDVVDAFLASTMMEPSDEREASGDPLFDRESRFGVFPAGAPMQLTFLGTASCIPSTSRGVSCTVLRNEGDLWLFDVGEGTQIQVTVRAAPMKHGVPCVGYTVEEADRPGRLKVEELNPILEEHKQAICNTTGRKDVGWMLGWIKSTKRGETITLPGTDVTLDSADYVGASVKGRKVVILGDTCDAASIVPLAMGADVVVHEATNTMLPPLDQGKTYADVEAEAIKHGHSTPMMAAAFAQRVGAKTLILNHFSARYRGDPSDASVAAMLRIERQAARAGGLERHQVVASWDLLEMPVVDADQWEANRATAREADAAFDGELLRRAQQWQQQQQEEVEGAGRSPSVSGTAATSSPVLSHEHEHSRDFLRDAAASGGGAASPRGSVAAASGPSNGGGDGGGGESSMMLRGHGGETAIEGGSAASGPGDDGSISRGDRETATVDGSGAAPAKTGLVGIMFDAVA
ncbi:conserved unknown protein [Ectocarpus siliculosus]|uniref:Uncharacterized protein n=1 Tax=Ectocarpus siliculosus TaxID=2880 RepID=D7FX51_ECTSI|nr:conserved unknown protein [Ectocarpus siliculosus]|eukprot:CBJ26384.1 conserved unknown protein [Ectocarpus siliculosus]